MVFLKNPSLSQLLIEFSNTSIGQSISCSAEGSAIKLTKFEHARGYMSHVNYNKNRIFFDIFSQHNKKICLIRGYINVYSFNYYFPEIFVSIKNSVIGA